MDNVRRRYPGVVYYIWGVCAIVEKVGTLKIEYWGGCDIIYISQMRKESPYYGVDQKFRSRKKCNK